MSVVRYVPPERTTVRRDRIDAPDLVHVITDAVVAAFEPGANKWALRNLTARLEEARLAATKAREIADLVYRVTLASASCAAELERLQADMLGHIVRRVEHELREQELEERRKTLAATVNDEAELALLRRAVERAKLQAQLDALQPRPPVTRPAEPTTERAAAARKRAESEARWIVEEVQVGHVPTDPETPYHAFAACTS